ncbi:MAG: branched-chain amino acid transaminase [Desulfurococcales archaeon]|nr:branched-chain amino acid transaminase [Desulfurococcales archaeon]
MSWGELIWFNGKLVKWDEAKIHVMTHSLHYGTSIFEGIRGYATADGKAVAIFRLKEHMERFEHSAKLIGFKLRYTVDELCEAVVQTVKANGVSDYYIRPIGFIGKEEMALVPSTTELDVAVGVLKWGKFLGKAYYEGAKVTVAGWRKEPQDVTPAQAKAGGHYVFSFMTSLQARARGFDEAVVLDHRGFIAEGSGENIFIVKDGVAYTPPTYAPILIGITRNSVIELLRNELGVEVVEKDLTLGDLITADEAFFTGTAAEITPIVEVDGLKIGNGVPGDVTKKLQKLYEDIVRGKNSKYGHWLAVVNP